MIKTIELTKNIYAIVDEEDYEYINKWKWSFDGNYASRSIYVGRENGKDKYKKIYMHRVINKTPKGMETDHINNNKLDNRKSNLRSATRDINAKNRRAYKNNPTKSVGVHYYKTINKYRASIVINKQRIHLGYFSNIDEAINARKIGEKRYEIRP